MTSKVREAILRVALDLFPSKSYSKVSVDEIASRAGVSKGALFHYFRSKLDLAAETLARLLARVVVRPVRRIVNSELPVGDKVDELVRLSLETSKRYGARSLSFLIEVYSELEEKGKAYFVREMYEELMGELESLFSGISGRPRARARILAAVLDGIAVQYMISPERFEGEELESLMEELRGVILCRTPG